MPTTGWRGPRLIHLIGASVLKRWSVIASFVAIGVVIYSSWTLFVSEAERSYVVTDVYPIDIQARSNEFRARISGVAHHDSVDGRKERTDQQGRYRGSVFMPLPESVYIFGTITNLHDTFIVISCTPVLRSDRSGSNATERRMAISQSGCESDGTLPSGTLQTTPECPLNFLQGFCMSPGATRKFAVVFENVGPPEKAIPDWLTRSINNGTLPSFDMTVKYAPLVEGGSLPNRFPPMTLSFGEGTMDGVEQRDFYFMGKPEKGETAPSGRNYFEALG